MQRNREPDGQVSVVFDMTDAGLSNMVRDVQGRNTMVSSLIYLSV